MPDTHARSIALFDMALLAAFTLIPIALSYLWLGGLSLRLDESQSLWQTTRSPENIITTIARDVHVPLYHLLLHSWREGVGDGVELARALSLLFYLLTIPATYLLGKISYSRFVGLFAALLVALSPFLNWYGNEIRMYTLFLFLATLNQYFFIRIFKVQDSYSWFFYALTALLGVFAHYFFLLNLFAQSVFYAFNHHRFPALSFLFLATTATLVAATLGPWAYYIYSIGDVAFQQPLLFAPTTVNFFNTFAEFIIGFQPDAINTAILSLWPIILLALGFFTLRKRSWLTPGGAYLLAVVFVSIPTAFLFSITVRPLFVSRYLIFTLPALYVLVAALISIYPPRFAHLARAILVGVMAAALFVMYKEEAHPLLEDYRGAAQYLTVNASAHDIVLISPPFTVYPIEYYYRGAAPIATLPEWDRYTRGPIPAFNEETLPADVTRITADYQNVWIILSYDQGYEEAIQQYFENNHERIDTVSFNADIELAQYRLRYDPKGLSVPAAPTADDTSLR